MISFTVNRFEDKERVVKETSMVVTSVMAEVVGNGSNVGTVFLHDQEVTKHYSAEDEHGRSHTVDDVESGIELIKEVHEESESEKADLRVEYSKIIDSVKKYAPVSEELYVKSGNVRTYLDNIFMVQHYIDLLQGKLNDIEASKSTEEYASIPSVLKDVIEEKVTYYKDEISKLQKERDEQLGYLKSSVGDNNQ